MVTASRNFSANSSSKAIVSALSAQSNQLISHLQSGQLFKIHAPNGNLLIVCHRYHAEIFGHGAAVGGVLDLDCRQLIPVGNVLFRPIQDSEERKQAYQKRQQWLNASQRIIENPVPLARAQTLLRTLEKYCGSEAIEELSNEILSELAGVLPNTMAIARRTPSSLSNRQNEQDRRLVAV